MNSIFFIKIKKKAERNNATIITLQMLHVKNRYRKINSLFSNKQNCPSEHASFTRIYVNTAFAKTKK